MNRYTTIDGLRGLAATAVMLHHFTGHRAFAPLASVLPSIANQALGVGNIGVPIFFVISGFVISNSIGLSRVDTYYILNFALRRSIRLDPPYWCTILLIVALDIVKSAVLSTPATPPSTWVLFTHATYTFELLGIDPLLAVFWTLCHEVQFYLVFCLLLAVFPRGNWLLIILFATGIASSLGLVDVRGLCLRTWYMFALGALLHCAISGSALSRWTCGAYVVFLVASLPWNLSQYRFAAIGTGIFLSLGIVRGTLRKWLAGRTLQYLGRVSYSLYLLHGVVGWLVLSIAADKFGITSSWGSLGWLIVAIAVSILSADLMCRFIERPSIALAKRLKPLNEDSSPSKPG